jgi:putative FmdB family regulatory protein
MPSYTFECPKCGHQRHEILSLAEHEDADFRHCKKPMRQVIFAPQIIKDIQPYQAMGADVANGGKPPRIGSRREHKEYLKRNGYVERGTEPVKPKKPVYDDVTPKEVKQTLDRVLGRTP